ncbi:hypothetical protein JNUCC0626_13415 [Lentzea sp. JNUCC 0626]|uniref:hypothetical protein n=1 Tax=Lentzea sp. JNUCC 0626 TaxID=3367513 RepID=UPI003749CEF0
MNWTLLLILAFFGLALVIAGYLVGVASAKPAAPSKLLGHHAIAVRMAGLAIQHSDDPEIRRIAFDIETDRVELITRALGRADDTRITKLGERSGRAFDVAFLKLMLRHDQAETALAKKVRAGHRSEVEELESLLVARTVHR